MRVAGKNVNRQVIEDFGAQWTKFDQIPLSATEREKQFDSYFLVFPWSSIRSDAVGFDAGCGSGRWAALVAPKVGHLHCVEPSAAAAVAHEHLRPFRNCTVHKTTIDDMPFDDDSMDFGYAIGVLHQLPDPERGMSDCVRKLRKGAPFLIYVCYRFDNQPAWFRLLWLMSDGVRRVSSRMPARLKALFSDVIALSLYYPLACAARGLAKLGVSVASMPLSAYRHRSFYSMRTDALDRFGTRLEHRYTRNEIELMMWKAGLTDVTFSDQVPYWCVVGVKR